MHEWKRWFVDPRSRIIADSSTGPFQLWSYLSFGDCSQNCSIYWLPVPYPLYSSLKQVSAVYFDVFFLHQITTSKDAWRRRPVCRLLCCESLNRLKFQSWLFPAACFGSLSCLRSRDLWMRLTFPKHHHWASTTFHGLVIFSFKSTVTCQRTFLMCYLVNPNLFYIFLSFLEGWLQSHRPFF